ncbi:unnamed protein product [Spirodela intermedia]|uniref:Uncharacterized protein n=1 Tax=Spirodela intermedia TaxID=51605 RepID=A0A7I8I993_SPIIN|nr:unnamed protein product [Spirodela intermedia]CAA6653491.1 unnamed protein product [Spirodela intermedia]
MIDEVACLFMANVVNMWGLTRNIIINQNV